MGRNSGESWWGGISSNWWWWICQKAGPSASQEAVAVYLGSEASPVLPTLSKGKCWGFYPQVPVCRLPKAKTFVLEAEDHGM